MSRAVTLGLLLALAAALALRCPQLASRPMHNDEANNAIKFRDLWEHDSFQYDPNEYHGPTPYYLTYAWEKLTGAPRNFSQFTEARFRLVTVLFGVGLVLLLPLIADGLGRRATVCAALATAISPAMVFYSRYYIHEMLLVFFTFLALAAGWRYTRSRKIAWALLAGGAVGLMQATKETFVLTLAAMLAALVLNGIWSRQLATAAHAPFKFNLEHAFAALAVWVGVWLVLFSSFFANCNGPLDAFRTYLPNLHRTVAASPHIHPWYFYLSRLAFFQSGHGPIWSEALILLLALIGIFAAFTRRGLSDSHPGFIRFLAFYALALTAIYSALPYKTPWCLLSFWHGMILLAGVGTVAVFQWTRRKRTKLVAAAILLAASAQLALQAWNAGVTWSADPSNPYVYAQTSPNLLELVSQIEALASTSPQGRETVIKVISPAADYWPLPWYLRQFKNTGWWNSLPPDPYAPIMIVSADLHANLDEKKTHVMVGIFSLRPQIFLELYVQSDLWRAYLERFKK
jgi:uncharacterized protein (TIGR03663 family)